VVGLADVWRGIRWPDCLRYPNIRMAQVVSREEGQVTVILRGASDITDREWMREAFPGPAFFVG
jgi:hypothetical protein